MGGAAVPRSRRFGGLLSTLAGAAQIALTVVGAPVLRGRYLRWGASPQEVVESMPGDDLVRRPRLGYTRAVTIDAPPDAVWPWLAQMGQGRGGLYSFDGLENLVRCDIHSAQRILEEHQRLVPGDLVRLGPDGYPCFAVVDIDRPRHLVLAGVDPRTHELPDLPIEEPDAVDAATWQWQLRPLEGGRRTRLLTRQRLTFPAREWVMWHLVEPVNFVMERRMLLGIRARAEGAPR